MEPINQRNGDIKTGTVRRIHELPKQVADKIAAGEVVDRPVSIVKELLENAIDAGAAAITIEIKNGGKSYIRVTDDGCGIPKEDVMLAFKRHATSKISEASDLDSILTLGFRGEALSSISAVSRTELITKTSASDLGYRVLINGGDVAEEGGIGCSEGTTVIVSDLFYNTPARQKFMKPDATESSLVIDFVSKMALAYPGIRIRLINNGSILFSTPGKGDIHTNILTVYSREIGNGLIHLTEQGSDKFYLEAFISPPSQSKTNRRNQIFFVNGRYVSSKVIERGVEDAYNEKLMGGRYPAAFLFLRVSPDALDVNIHPNKKEVRFDSDREIKEFITKALIKGLDSRAAIPDMKPAVNIFKKSATNYERDTPHTASSVVSRKMANEASDRSKDEQVDIKKLLELRRSEKGATAPLKTDRVAEKSEPYQASSDLVQASVIPDRPAGATGPILEVPQVHGFDIRALQITGSIFDTYITAVADEFFYLIDQHAAHERIFYEQLLTQFSESEKAQQVILTPFVINVSYTAKHDAYSWLDFLNSIGFAVEEFGPKAYIIKAVPYYMNLSEAQDFIGDFMDNLSEDMSFQDQKKLDKIITNACKKAVKAHDKLSFEEMKQLLADLSKTRNPYSCPHGRPVFVKLSKYEIEKMFKRIV